MAHLQRTKVRSRRRWCYYAAVSDIYLTTARVGKWTADEDKKLEGCGTSACAKNGETIAALVPGQTRKNYCDRWTKYVDHPNRSSSSRR